MSRPTKIFSGALGLNIRDDPTRLKIDSSGLCELPEAVNVDIEKSYRVSRRPGTKSTSCTSSVHSLFSIPGTTLCVSGSDLCRLESGYSLTTIRSGLTLGARMRYVQVGNQIFYSNGHENGIYSLSSGTSSDWTAGTYYGPRTNRTFSSPPVGHLLEHFNGRIYIAQDNVLWHTEPFAYSWVDFSQNFFWFDSRLTMVRAVPDGLVISTMQGLFLLAGSGPAQFIQRGLTTYPAIEGTDTVCDTEDLPDIADYISGQSVIFTTTKGICLAGAEGFFRNLTKRKIYYPVQSIGTAYIYRGKYVVIME